MRVAGAESREPPVPASGQHAYERNVTLHDYDGGGWPPTGQLLETSRSGWQGFNAEVKARGPSKQELAVGGIR
jgi:hypothetical protein